MINIKPELVICPAGQRDFVLKEEEDSKEAAQRFFDSGSGLEQLIQIVNYSERLTIISKAMCEVYVRKTYLVNSILS